MADGQKPIPSARACVFAPTPLLTTTVELRSDDSTEIHLHAGGQGFWIARMLRQLGVPVTLCGTFGSEVGPVVRQLIEAAGIDVRGIATAGDNGVYVHDRRSGERKVVAESQAPPLSRHEADELYGAVIGETIDAAVCVLAGPGSDAAVASDMYGRLAADLQGTEVPTVADLSGERLAAVLDAGVTVLKVSDDELARDGRLDPAEASPDALDAAARRLERDGAANVVITRAELPTLALLDGHFYEALAPQLAPVDTRGAGDSLTAGIAAGLTYGLALTEALRLGAAAGGLNITRRGLATGEREDIERLARRVELTALDPKAP